MTFIEKFEQLKKKYFSKADFSGLDGDLAVQISLTDEDCGGTFYLAHIDGKTEIMPYDYRDNDVQISLDSALLEGLLSGRKSAVREFINGNIDAEGDPQRALALVEAVRKKSKKAVEAAVRKE